MTTTNLYSGYDTDGKPTSRVLRPPGGGSSDIFGSSEPPQQQLKKQEQREMYDANQNQAVNSAAAPPPPSQTQSAQQQPKRKGGSDAPYAENDNENPYGRHKSSQNEEDFRCHSVTAYREAVVRNAAVKERAHGGKATAANPITHQDKNGEGPYNHHSNDSQQQQSYAAANRGYGSKGHGQDGEIRDGSAMPHHSSMAYKDAVNRNAEIRHKYHGGGQASGSFNPITHQEFTGEELPPSHYQHAPPPYGQQSQHAPQPFPQTNQQPDLMDRENYGRREIIRASSYNPITGEEYPEDYGKKRGEAAKNGEEKDKDLDNINHTCTPTPAQTPTGTPGSNSTPTTNTVTNNTPNTPSSAGTKARPSSRVLQPPGGASSGLW